MTTYNEDTNERFTDGATVPAGQVLEVTRINGIQIPRDSGFPVAITLPKGTLLIYRDGTPVYEDNGVIVGHPALGATVGNGSVTIVLGVPLFNTAGDFLTMNEAISRTWTISLVGIAASAVAPILTSVNPLAGSTGVAQDTVVTATFSKPVKFGTGVIELRNATANTLIESFDVVTEVGTAPGQVSVSSAQVRLRSTVALPASTLVSLRIAATAIKDLANNAYAGLLTDAQSFTTTATAPVSTGTYYFGALTPQGQAGFPATSLVDASSHFSLVGGRVVVSNLGDTADLNGTPYSVTVNGAAVTIVAVPNAISVSNISQAAAAIASFQASPTVDSTVLMRNGDDWAYTSTKADDYFDLGLPGMSGSFTDANSSGFATSVTAQTYNADAIASLTGGSITIRPDTPLGATIRAQIRINSGAKFIFDGVVIESVPPEDARSLTETVTGGPVAIPGTVSIPTATTNALILIGNSSGAVPTGTTIFRNCYLGGTRFGTPVTRYGSYLRASGAGHFVVEDCEFNGYFNAMNGGESRHHVVRRNTSQRKIGDFSRCLNTTLAITGAATPVYYEIVKNTDWNMLGSVNGDGGFHYCAYHSDFSQCGGPREQTDVSMTSAYNIHLGEMDRSDPTARIIAYYNGTLGRPDFTAFDFAPYPRRRSQAIFANFQATGMKRFGTCYKDTMIGNVFHAYTNGKSCQMNLVNCLFLQGVGTFTNSLGDPPAATWALRLGVGLNNVVENTIYLTGSATSGYTFINNAILNLNPTGPQSYNSNFAGTFAAGSFGPQIAFNLTNGAAAFRADVQAKLASRVGSLAAGKGPWA